MNPRLKRRAEFLRVASKGRKAPSPGLVLQALLRGDEAPVRLGFTVTKKVGNAVVRNRTRRRLREAARLLLRESPAVGADLVLVGRDTTRARPFGLLIDDLRRGLSKLAVPTLTGLPAAALAGTSPRGTAPLGTAPSATGQVTAPAHTRAGRP